MLYRQLLTTTALGIAVFALGACASDDNPLGPSNGGASGRDFDVVLYADMLSVDQDCDAATSSASAAAGDFFIRAELRRVVGETSTVIAATEYQLVQANDGESKALGIEAAGSFRASSGARLEAVINIYENDPDRRHFDRPM